jgi:chromosome segregation ATPase
MDDRALEMERSDLLDTYRTCLQEKRRLESDMNAMRCAPPLLARPSLTSPSGTKTKLAQTIYDLRSEIGDLQDELNSRRAAENRQLAERSSLLLQLETLNGQLVETSKRASDWETDANKQAQVSRSRLPPPLLLTPSLCLPLRTTTA